MKMLSAFLLALLALMPAAIPMAPSDEASESQFTSRYQMIDNEPYIDANNILMFITNHGNFARDLAHVFGHDYGCYFPYRSLTDITNWTLVSPVLYSAGLWLSTAHLVRS